MILMHLWMTYRNICNGSVSARHSCVSVADPRRFTVERTGKSGDIILMIEDVVFGFFRGTLKIVEDRSPHEALNMDITECYQLLEIEPTDSFGLSRIYGDKQANNFSFIRSKFLNP